MPRYNKDNSFIIHKSTHTKGKHVSLNGLLACETCWLGIDHLWILSTHSLGCSTCEVFFWTLEHVVGCVGAEFNIVAIIVLRAFYALAILPNWPQAGGMVTLGEAPYAGETCQAGWNWERIGVEEIWTCWQNNTNKLRWLRNWMELVQNSKDVCLSFRGSTVFQSF